MTATNIYSNFGDLQDSPPLSQISFVIAEV